MKNAFYFTLKTILFVKIFRFFTWLFEKWLDKEAKVNFEIYDVTDWKKNNYYTSIAQYLKK